MSRNSLEIRTGRPGLASPDSWAEHDGHAATRLTRTPTILRPRDCIHAKHCIAVLQASVSFSISGTANVIIRQLICIPNTIAIMQCSYNFSSTVDDFWQYSLQSSARCFLFSALRPNPIMTLRYNLLPGRLRCLRSRVGASGAGVTIEDFDSRPGWCSTVLWLCCSVGISAGHQSVTKKYSFNIILYDASIITHHPKPKYP